MNKYIKIFILLILAPLLLTGCWNYAEIENLSIVSGVAVDKCHDAQYKLTIELIDVNTNNKEVTFKSSTILSKGNSIFDAVRNSIKLSGKKLYWGHATTVIVSQSMAKEGILPLLDWIMRDSEPRISLHLLVAETENAKDIFKLQPVSTEIISFEIENIINSSVNLSKVYDIKAYELINEISEEGIHPVIPLIGKENNDGINTMVVTGSAILNKDALAGFLTLDETKYLLFIRNKIKGGLLPVSFDGNNVTLEIFKNKTKVTPEFSDRNLSMKLDIKTTVSIGEVNGDISVMDPKILQEIKATAESNLEKNILQLIKKVQRDVGLDIFGFGIRIKNDHPKMWKTIEEDWDELFKELDIEVNSDIHIRGSGHVFKAVQNMKENTKN